ncbi:MAG: hypothetical protein L0312_01085, partial [Acidobacteria bacterium]|nr:hypothetical protein [Acidobacteriota bacterium]
ARCLVNLGRNEEARQAAQAELAIASSHPDARQLLAELSTSAAAQPLQLDRRNLSSSNKSACAAPKFGGRT